jgi:hypothetical protein
MNTEEPDNLNSHSKISRCGQPTGCVGTQCSSMLFSADDCCVLAKLQKVLILAAMIVSGCRRTCRPSYVVSADQLSKTVPRRGLFCWFWRLCGGWRHQSISQMESRSINLIAHFVAGSHLPYLTWIGFRSDACRKWDVERCGTDDLKFAASKSARCDSELTI